MLIRFSLCLIFSCALLQASEKEKFITAFLYKHGITDEKNPRRKELRPIADRLYFVWNYHKKSKKNEEHIENCRKCFVTVYLRDMELENNDVNILLASVFFNLMVYSFDQTIAETNSSLESYQSRLRDFNNKLMESGAIWVTKEKEDEFWQGHEEWKEWQ